MVTDEFCQEIKSQILEKRNMPQTMESPIVHLRKIDCILMRINESSTKNRAVLEINFIPEEPV